jgi:hypothetical protein
MSYSDLYFRQKSRPSIIMIVIALVSILSFLTLFLANSHLPSRATKAALLRNQITNLAPNQVTLFWQTDQKETGWIMYGQDINNLNQIAEDERDVSTNKQSYFYHYVTLKDLKEDKSYYYKIVSNERVYLDLNGQAFSFKTPKNASFRSTWTPAYGMIIDPNGLPTEKAFVVFNFQGKFPLLAMTRAKGEFMIPLNFLVDQNNFNIIVPEKKETVNVEIIKNDGKKTTITAFLDQTNPFSQTLITGKDMNITVQDNVLGTTVDNSQNQTVINNSVNNTNVNIIFPKENAVIPAQKPLFKGTAFPGKMVYISINSKPEFDYRTQADNDGSWKVTPDNPLAAGNYILTLNTVDAQEKKITLIRNFIIGKSGEQVLGEATGASQLTPTLAPTTTLVPTTPPTVTQTPPQTGMNSNILLILSTAFMVVGAGVLLVF